jgi:hypothetical protein
LAQVGRHTLSVIEEKKREEKNCSFQRKSSVNLGARRLAERKTGAKPKQQRNKNNKQENQKRKKNKATQRRWYKQSVLQWRLPLFLPQQQQNSEAVHANLNWRAAPR